MAATPRGEIAIDEAGAGTAVVLSHGLGDDAGTWSAIWPLLSAAHRVVRWDLPGHGRRGAPPAPDGYSAAAAVGELLDVIDQTGAPVHLVGHSLGGYLSLTVALRRPELVRSLTLVASGPGFRDPAARQAWNAYVSKTVVRMPVPESAAGLAHQHDSWVIDHLANLPAPLLIVVGERDERFHAGADYMARVVPTAATCCVAGAGHHPQLSHPREVADALLAHFAAAEREP